jgi:glycosyltransferase involved in cell wall biosynthesis
MNRFGLVDIIPFELPILLMRKKIHQADVIHFHDISGTCSTLTPVFLSWFKRVVWTLHDTSILTGGCIQPAECKTFGKGCGKCPQLGKWPLNTTIDLTNWILKFKRICLKLSRVEYVAPSIWLHKLCYQQLGILPKLIRNGVSKDIFFKQSTSRKNKISSYLKVLISATNLKDVNKVNHQFLKFIDDYHSDEILILLMGNSDNLTLNTKFKVKILGYINDEISKAKLYKEVDLLLFPSMGENCPLTILEAVCCGLPIVCFSNTGMTELINELKLTELVKRPRLLDNLPKPIDENVSGLSSMYSKYIKVYQNLI